MELSFNPLFLSSVEMSAVEISVNYTLIYTILFVCAWGALLVIACFVGVRRLKNVLCACMLGVMFVAFKLSGGLDSIWFYGAVITALVCIGVTWLVPIGRR